MPDVRFYYQRKKTPKISDDGVMDISLLGDKGTNIEISWVIRSFAGQPCVIYAKEAACLIDDLAVHVKSSQHKYSSKLASKAALKRIKLKLEAAIADSALGFGTWFADKLNYCWSGIAPPQRIKSGRTHFMFETAKQQPKPPSPVKENLERQREGQPRIQPQLYQRGWEREYAPVSATTARYEAEQSARVGYGGERVVAAAFGEKLPTQSPGLATTMSSTAELSSRPAVELPRFGPQQSGTASISSPGGY